MKRIFVATNLILILSAATYNYSQVLNPPELHLKIVNKTKNEVKIGVQNISTGNPFTYAASTQTPTAINLTADFSSKLKANNQMRYTYDIYIYNTPSGRYLLRFIVEENPVTRKNYMWQASFSNDDLTLTQPMIYQGKGASPNFKNNYPVTLTLDGLQLEKSIINVE